MITENSTLKEAKDFLRQNLSKGETCPCCNRHAQMYSRTITSSMAYALILIYKAFKEGNNGSVYIHIEDFFKSIPGLPSAVRGDAPKLRFWDLIRPDGKDKDDGNPNTGYYKITELGKAFVEGNMEVSKHAKIYNNKFFGFDKDSGNVSIHDCLKNKFNYKNLMS